MSFFECEKCGQFLDGDEALPHLVTVADGPERCLCSCCTVSLCEEADEGRLAGLRVDGELYQTPA